MTEVDSNVFQYQLLTKAAIRPAHMTSYKHQRLVNQSSADQRICFDYVIRVTCSLKTLKKNINMLLNGII